jgi:N-acetylglucosamine-6-phosphate deacetylase
MIYTNCQIVHGDQLIQGAIEIEGTQIKRIITGPVSGVDMKGCFVLPGLIDQHIHGGFGVDLMSASVDEMNRFSQALLAHGITGYYATTLTVSMDQLLPRLAQLASFIETQEPLQAQCLGIHLEGPFISKKFPGAQDPAHILAPDKVLLETCQQAARGQIKLITYAPEVGHSLFTSFAVSLGIIPSIGHSAANLVDVDQAIQEGARQMTHFHNASSGYHHREPGIVNAGLFRDQLHVELIADGVHVHPEVLRGVLRIKGASSIKLITDAVSAMGEPDGPYQLAGLPVTKQAGTVRLADGTLAGSALDFQTLLYNVKQMMTDDITQLAAMTHSYQTTQVEEGQEATLVFLDPEWTVTATMVQGTMVYQR